MIKWNSFVPLLVKNTLLLIVAAFALIGLGEYVTEATLISHLEWEFIPTSIKMIVLCIFTFVPVLLTLCEIQYDNEDSDEPRPSWLDD